MTPADAERVLGLAAPWSEDDLASAFRRAALGAHPDQGGSDEKMRVVLEARTLLRRTGPAKPEPKREPPPRPGTLPRGWRLSPNGNPTRLSMTDDGFTPVWVTVFQLRKGYWMHWWKWVCNGQFSTRQWAVREEAIADADARWPKMPNVG